MMTPSPIDPCAVRPRRVLCSPYHLYTHRDALALLFPLMAERGWEASMLLPFTAPSTLAAMAEEARRIPGLQAVHDPTWRAAVREGDQRPLWRAARAFALLLHFARTALLLLRWRPDLIVLTSDLGGVSVRFLQLVARRLGIVIVTIQTTLFLRVTERKDLKFELRPRWLHKLLSRGVFKRLFLYFGEIPGSFLPESFLAVQDEEIRDICVEMGPKDPDRVAVLGSLQAAAIRAAREPRGARPRVLLLTECVEERFGEAKSARDIEWLHAVALALSPRAEIGVRFHPRESEAFRQRLKERFGPLFAADPAPDAIRAAGHADVVVGAFSMLMFDAQAAGVPVVFMDAGLDPIGFYADRRRPLATSAEELVHMVARAIETPTDAACTTAPISPEAWGRAVVDWMADLVQTHELARRKSL